MKTALTYALDTRGKAERQTAAATDADGRQSQVWSELFVRWCGWEPLRTREHSQLSATWPDARARVVFRADSLTRTLKSRDRVEVAGGWWDILNVRFEPDDGQPMFVVCTVKQRPTLAETLTGTGWAVDADFFYLHSGATKGRIPMMAFAGQPPAVQVEPTFVAVPASTSSPGSLTEWAVPAAVDWGYFYTTAGDWGRQALSAYSGSLPSENDPDRLWSIDADWLYTSHDLGLNWRRCPLAKNF